MLRRVCGSEEACTYPPPRVWHEFRPGRRAKPACLPDRSSSRPALSLSSTREGQVQLAALSRIGPVEGSPKDRTQVRRWSLKPEPFVVVVRALRKAPVSKGEGRTRRDWIERENKEVLVAGQVGWRGWLRRRERDDGPCPVESRTAARRPPPTRAVCTQPPHAAVCRVIEIDVCHQIEILVAWRTPAPAQQTRGARYESDGTGRSPIPPDASSGHSPPRRDRREISSAFPVRRSWSTTSLALFPSRKPRFVASVTYAIHVPVASSAAL